MSLHPSSLHRPDGASIEYAADDLRPLAAFLDLCLPLDRASEILALTPAPEPSAGDVLAALDRAIAHEVRRGRLVQIGTQRVCWRCGTVAPDPRAEPLCSDHGLVSAHSYRDEPVYGLGEVA